MWVTGLVLFGLGCSESTEGDAGPKADTSVDASSVAEAGQADALGLDGADSEDAGRTDAYPEDQGVVDAGDFRRAHIGGDVALAGAGTATVTIIHPSWARSSTVTHSDGSFDLWGPEGESVLVQVDAPGHVSRIQGYVLGTGGAGGKTFYMTPIAALEQAEKILGVSLNPSKGLLWIDFRNSTTGGYGAELSVAHGPPFTLDYDLHPDGYPVASDHTTAGVPGSELIFMDVPAGLINVMARPPTGHECQPRDELTDWMIVPGVMTQIDFECL